VQNILETAERWTSVTSLRLLQLLKTNDPFLRVMGLFASMRTLDLEIEKSETKESIPSAMMQALSHISVLAAVCKRQLSINFTYHTRLTTLSLQMKQK